MQDAIRHECPECAALLDDTDRVICPDCAYPLDQNRAPEAEDQDLIQAANAARRSKTLLFSVVLLGWAGLVLVLNQSPEPAHPAATELPQRTSQLPSPDPLSDEKLTELATEPGATETQPPETTSAETDPGTSSPVNASDIESTLQSWQSIKRAAFLGKDLSRLSEILTGTALEETRGALQWWLNNDAQYYDIQLHELTILDQSKPSETTAEVKVRISETKDNSVQGRNTSTYQATYSLEKQAGRWYISHIQAE